MNQDALDRRPVTGNLPHVAFSGVVEALQERREGQGADVGAVHGRWNGDFGEAAIFAGDEERIARGVKGDRPAADGEAVAINEGIGQTKGTGINKVGKLNQWKC